VDASESTIDIDWSEPISALSPARRRVQAAVLCLIGLLFSRAVFLGEPELDPPAGAGRYDVLAYRFSKT